MPQSASGEWQHERVTRTRGDLCPGVFRPWPADDGALVRLRTPGGQTSIAELRALVTVAEEYGDGNVHLTSRANLQVRGFPLSNGTLPTEAVEAIQSTGLLPNPSHELIRNIMASPLTGLAGGRADLRPVVTALDQGLCRHPSLAYLPGRFLFVLDDGRGDLIDRPLDLGLVAVSATEVQIRIGKTNWGPVVPLTEAAGRLVGLARAFLTVRGEGETAAWHIDELPVPPAGEERDPRTERQSAPTPYGPVPGTGLAHHAAPDGIVDRAFLDRWAGGDGGDSGVVITPWRGIVADAH